MHVQDLSHRQTWDLIPLLVNESATAAEHALAQAHLSGCADCRDEYAFQTRLQAGMAATCDVATDSYAGLRSLLRRIDDDDREDAVDHTRSTHRAAHGVRARRSSPRQLRTRPLLAAVMAQSVALALLGVFVLTRPGGQAPTPIAAPQDAAAYRTLSQTGEPEPAAAIRLVPAPDLSIAALQSLLSESGLRIVAVNQDNTIYTLALSASPPADQADRDARVSIALVRLRAQRGVLLAEPVAVQSPGTWPQ
jgi:hypothetical protein